MIDAPSSRPDATLDRRAWLVLGCVCLATVAVFANALRGELVYDDALLVARNPDLGSLANVPRFFERPHWAFLEPETSVGFWRPLTATMLALGHSLGGGETWGFHLSSMLCHVLAVSGAFLFTLRFARDLRVAGFTALLFAVHPLQVEGVAWISALNDPLCVAATLWASWCWLGWRRRGSAGLPLGAAVWLVIALLTKETGLVVLPLVFLVDAILERGGTPLPRRSNAAGYGLFGACLLGWVLARMAVFASPWAGFDRLSTHLGASAGRLALLRVELFGGALRLLAWPAPLSSFRPFRPHPGLGDPELRLSVLAVLAFAVLVVMALRRRANRLLFALALVPASLAVMLLRVESLGIFPLSDRYLSLAVLGFALALVLVLEQAPRAVSATCLCALAASYALASHGRVAVWRNDESLYRDAVAQAPHSPRVRWGLGQALLARYRATEDPDYLNEAEAAFVAAQDLLVDSREPDSDVLADMTDFLQANLGYGWTRLFQDERSGFPGSKVALQIFEELAERVEAVEERRLDARSLGVFVEPTYLELENVQTAVGVALMRLGRLDEAESALRKAIERNPSYPEAHQNLGELYALRGEWELALRHFERAAELRPGSPGDRLRVARALAELGQHERAAALARELADEVEGAEPLRMLARIAVVRGDTEEAMRWSERAVAADERSGPAWYLRGQALILAGDRTQATLALSRAAELAPQDFAAAYDLGVMLARQGRVDEARRELSRAYELCDDERLRKDLRRALEGFEFASAEPLLRLAVADARRLDNEAALAWLERALALAPDDPETLLQKARVLRRMERHDEALALMRRACDLLPSSFPAHTELGAYLTERGLTSEAVATLEHAAELGPPRDWPPEIATEALAELERRLQALGSDAAGGG